MIMSGFTVLSTVLGTNILFEWIKLNDFVKFDSACNSHSTRSAFLKYCESGTLKNEFIDLRSPEQIQWFITRKLKLRKLSTSLLEYRDGIDKLLSKLLVCVGSHVKEIGISPNISFTSEQIVHVNTIIAQNCLNIQVVEITTESTEMEISPLLCALKYIQELYISDSNFPSASCYIIANMCAMNLKILYLDSIDDVCDAGLTVLAGKCPELEQLCIKHCKHVTVKGVLALVKTTPKLTVLNITISDLSDTDITTIAQHCPMLHTIGIDAMLITDVGIQAIVRYCTQLHTINVKNCVNISTGYSFFRNLHKLTIFNCPTLTDTMVATIVQNNPLLESLILSHCKRLTYTTVLSILDVCLCIQPVKTILLSTVISPL